MPTFTEAPAVWTVRYLSGAGFECQLTISGESDKEVLEKAGALVTPQPLTKSNAQSAGLQLAPWSA
jgi:hypothetical protein